MSRVESVLEALLSLERPLLVALDVDGTLSPRSCATRTSR